MTDASHLDRLPSEVLIIIFDYCHAFDLVRLSEVCTRFYEIINTDTLWIKKSRKALVTNQTSEKFRQRCRQLLCLRTKWHTSQNWQFGRYKQTVIFSQRNKLMPWLQLTSDTLWWSGGNQLLAFKRAEQLQNSRTPNISHLRSDISKFVLWRDLIISAHRNGNLNFWTKTPCENGRLWFTIMNAHSSDINGIDTVSNAIISGSNDGIVKVWRSTSEKVWDTTPACINVLDRIWSIAASPSEVKFAVGSSGNNNRQSLHIYDIECCRESNKMSHPWRYGAGILDMVWDNPNILLTCGYDTYIRKWDLRTGTCVNSWVDPTDAALYCISSDYQYSMIVGAQYNCKAVLWDQRQRDYIQLYFMNLHRLSSPVYSLRFDSSHLYCATDQYMVELTFSGHSYAEKNYKGLIAYDWRF